jgi:hypothetical protein
VDKREFAIAHRKFTRDDEWGAYLLCIGLLALHLHADWPLWPLIIAASWAIICIGVSYYRQWEMERNLDETS